MADRILIEDLSVAPSRVWPTIIDRHHAVMSYLKIGNPTTADADRSARQLGLSRRMFYRLINGHRERSAGRSSATSITGRGRPVSFEQEVAISDALTRLGPGAWTRDVNAEVAEICAARGISAPSDYAVNTRVRAPGRRVGLRARLRSRFDWILDTAQLDFDVVEGDGNTGRAYLLAFTDARTGETLAHEVRAGKPSSLALANLILPKLPQLQRPSHGRSRLAVTKRLWAEAMLLKPLLTEHGVEAAECEPRTIRSGEAMLLVFGRKIGNISLRARAEGQSVQGEQAAIDLALAQAVVASLVTNRNEELSSTPSGGSIDIANPRQGGAKTTPQYAP